MASRGILARFFIFGRCTLSVSETLHLAADLSFIQTDYLWRMPDSWRGYRYYGPELFEDVARIAQRGFFDLLFFGDAAETSENYGGNFDATVRNGFRWPKHDMSVMVPLMARVAPNVGFGLTTSTTYQHPFHVARLFSSLDWITGGRIAWNAVTSAFKNEGANWGFDELLPSDERYDRATEFMEVVRKLWDSIEPDALTLDRETGIFGDPAKVHLLNHRGKHFNVRGPLPAMPSPQGRPVVVQAGQSEPGMTLAAKMADLQFVARRTEASIAAHRSKLDSLLVKHGRNPRDVGCLWMVRVQVAESESEARAKDKAYLDKLPPDAGLIDLSYLFGIDFSQFRTDMRIVDATDIIKRQKAHWGTFEELLKTADPEMTIGELTRTAVLERGNHIVGNPKQVADYLERMHDAGGRNGGIILARPTSVPRGFMDFVDYVVPELQRRGLVRTKYEGSTLRDNLNS